MSFASCGSVDGAVAQYSTPTGGQRQRNTHPHTTVKAPAQDRGMRSRSRRFAPEPGQCIMKERPASEGRSRMWCRLRSAALCRASLRYGG
jgi:hypothetical protein